MNKLTKIAIFTIPLSTMMGSQMMLAHVAQANQPDPVVKKALDQAGLSYTMTSRNDFKVVIIIDKKRKQSVYINSGVEKVSNISIRKIYSFIPEKRLDEKTLNAALSRSGNRVIGGWEMGEDDKLVFTSKVDSNLTSFQLRTAIDAVANDTDQFEADMEIPDEK